jgi:hypothetical protein
MGWQPKTRPLVVKLSLCHDSVACIIFTIRLPERLQRTSFNKAEEGRLLAFRGAFGVGSVDLCGA